MKAPRTLKATTHAFHSDRAIGELRKQVSSLMKTIDEIDIEIHDAHELQIVMVMVELRTHLQHYIDLTHEIRRLRELPL